LGGEEVLLLLARGGVDVRREVVGDRVLAVEEEGVQPERAAALLGREALVPVLAVAREVDLRRAPVAALPARVEVLVGDGVGRTDRHADILSDRPVSCRVTSVTQVRESSAGARWERAAGRHPADALDTVPRRGRALVACPQVAAPGSRAWRRPEP